MAQITVRIPERLAVEVRAAAAARGVSMNAFLTAVMRAVVDPDSAEPGVAALRERLARAGLLAPPGRRPRRARPDAAAIARARALAGQGTPLSELVSADRE